LCMKDLRASIPFGIVLQKTIRLPSPRHGVGKTLRPESPLASHFVY
jgi:hypothetical protein